LWSSPGRVSSAAARRLRASTRSAAPSGLAWAMGGTFPCLNAPVHVRPTASHTLAPACSKGITSGIGHRCSTTTRQCNWAAPRSAAIAPSTPSCRASAMRSVSSSALAAATMLLYARPRSAAPRSAAAASTPSCRASAPRSARISRTAAATLLPCARPACRHRGTLRDPCPGQLQDPCRTSIPRRQSSPTPESIAATPYRASHQTIRLPVAPTQACILHAFQRVEGRPGPVSGPAHGGSARARPTPRA